MKLTNGKRPLQRRSPRVRPIGGGGYPKGDETRRRILDAALDGFGRASFEAVSTRQIAGAAGVSLPTLTYYFGCKEGLYRACAEVIVERYRRHTAGAGARAAEALRAKCTPEEARAHLKAVVSTLCGLLVGTREAEGWAQFVSRELREPGPAFEIMYSNLWQPGVELTARLIARILGSPDTDPAPRIQALLLISSLLAFQSGRQISLRALRWPTVGQKELAMVQSCLNSQIDVIGRIGA